MARHAQLRSNKRAAAANDFDDGLITQTCAAVDRKQLAYESDTCALPL
jgi:hypothetical protein